MPHIVVEHCPQTAKAADLSKLCNDLHEKFAEKETIKLENIKTRTVLCDNLITGSDIQPRPFCHVTVKLLPGRSPELKEQISGDLFATLCHHINKDECSVSLELRDLGTYQK